MGKLIHDIKFCLLVTAVQELPSGSIRKQKPKLARLEDVFIFVPFYITLGDFLAILQLMDHTMI